MDTLLFSFASLAHFWICNKEANRWAQRDTSIDTFVQHYLIPWFSDHKMKHFMNRMLILLPSTTNIPYIVPNIIITHSFRNANPFSWFDGLQCIDLGVCFLFRWTKVHFTCPTFVSYGLKGVRDWRAQKQSEYREKKTCNINKVMSCERRWLFFSLCCWWNSVDFRVRFWCTHRSFIGHWSV